jgi:hypothetical protein
MKNKLKCGLRQHDLKLVDLIKFWFSLIKQLKSLIVELINFGDLIKNAAIGDREEVVLVAVRRRLAEGRGKRVQERGWLWLSLVLAKWGVGSWFERDGFFCVCCL